MHKERKKLLSTKDVAEWFGVNPMTIYRKARRGEIPAIKFGKNWLFSEDILNEWLSKKINMTKSSIQNVSFEGGAFAKLKPLLLVYLFGSIVSGHDTPQSDVDIAYLDDGRANPFDFEVDLEACVREALPHAPRINLIRLNNAPIAVRYRVIKTGRLLYAKSDEARARFEEDVVMRYLDYELVLAKFYKEVV